MISKIIAIIIILTSFIGGFMMAGGSLISLWHPAELVVILGVSLGVFLAATPVYVWKKTVVFIGRFFKGGRVDSQVFEDTLSLLDDLSRLARKDGILSLEKHVLVPRASQIFLKYPLVLNHKELTKFISENFSYLLLIPPTSLNFKGYLEDQVEDIIQSMMEVPRATAKIASLLPGFGIVAAVMGVILTMNLLGGDMDVANIGVSIGAALVGTLTGIFLSFGLVSPFTHAVQIMIRQDRAIFEMTISFLDAFSKGVSPKMAYEVGRQRIPAEFDLSVNRD